MSRQRVIVGTDARGRPVCGWTDLPNAASPYAHMQPAYSTDVARRRATRAELAASLARDTATGYLAAKPVRAGRRVGAWTPEATAERMRTSRARGVTRSHASAAATAAQQAWNGTGLRAEEER